MIKTKLIKVLDKYFTTEGYYTAKSDQWFKEIIVDDILETLQNHKDLDLTPIFTRIHDVFPGDVYIGGSFAYNKALGLPEDSNDIDIFICNDRHMSSYAFMEVLKSIVFKDLEVGITKGEANRYKMKEIKKRFTAEVEGVTFDFIFTRDDPKSLVNTRQGSTISEVLIPLSYDEGINDRLTRIVASAGFMNLSNSVKNKNDIYYEVREHMCTSKHRSKIERVVEKLKKLIAKR